MSNQDFLELVWEDGQLVTRGFTKRAEKSNTCIDHHHPSHSSNARLESVRNNKKNNQHDEEYSLLNELHNKANINYCTSTRDHHHHHHHHHHDVSGDDDDQDKLLKESQVVPVHEITRTRKSDPVTSPLLKRPRVKSSPNLVSLDQMKKEEVVVNNFSLFSRSSTPRAVVVEPPEPDEKPLLVPAGSGSETDGAVEAGKRVAQVEAVVPSCSLGASNNYPTCTNCTNTLNLNMKRHRYHEDDHIEGSANDYTSDDDLNHEEEPERKAVTTPRRRPRVHNLSERKRRNKINKKMRVLQELIPNCSTKVDKASMLDEAIDYLKRLQFQVKMMSMGSGFCMPPTPMMMLPTGMQQHLHHGLAPQQMMMTHLSPMAMATIGMQMRMGIGYNQFLIPAGSTAVPAGFQMPHHHFPGQPQPLPMSVPMGLNLMHQTPPPPAAASPFISPPAASTSMELMDSAPFTYPLSKTN